MKRTLPTSLACVLLAASTLALAQAADPSEDEMIRALTPQPPAPLTRSLARGAQVRGAPEGRLAITVQFELGSARITPQSAATLSRLATAMKAPALGDRHFRIEGHTDATGHALGNTRLSGRRAESVRDFLRGAGVDPARMSTIGLGSAALADRQDPAAAANRRVVVLSLEQAQVQASAGSAATVQRMTGRLKVKRGDREQDVEPGTRLREGDTLATEPGSDALVRLDDGAQLLLREDSRLEVGKLQVAGDASTWSQALNLLSGAMRYLTGALGQSRPQAVRLTTFTSTIGIRGTDLDIVAVPEGSDARPAGTYVKVNHGAVAVSAADGSRVELQASEQAFASTPKAVTRGGKREPAAVKVSAPADVFRTGVLDELLDAK